MYKLTNLKLILFMILILFSNFVLSAIAVDDQFVVIENSGATIIDAFANDTIDKGEAVTTFTQPANGVVILELFGMTYEPNNGYCNNGINTDDFTYTLTGGSTATVAITVSCLSVEARVIPVNQIYWLLFLFFTILIVAKQKYRKT